METLQTLKERGFVHQLAGDEKKIFAAPRTFYLGIDPSADSFQIGNLAPLMLARQLTKQGHRAIILIGGATGTIGDPSGKENERVLQDIATIEKNARAQIKQIQKIFGTKDFLVVNNAKWLSKLNLLEFLRDVGKHFTVNNLVKRDLIRKRLETENNSISYTEFSYALLQAYDFYHLYKKYSCALQIGASDQWGNIVSGIELIHKKEGVDTYGLTMPLITDTEGKKFGKSEGNAVWLDPQKTSPFTFYQFWLNTSDDELEKLLKIYTDFSIENINILLTAPPQERKGQKKLAYFVTALVHGEKYAERAKIASEALFSGNMGNIDANTKSMLLGGAPNISVALGDTVENILLKSKLVTSKGEARRLIEAGGVRINDTKITSSEENITKELFSNNLALLKKGKREVVILVLK